MTIPLQSQSVPNRILFPHNLERQCASNAEKHKERPLPSKRVDHNAKHEPVNQLRVREEVKGSGRRTTLDELGHVDPFLHPTFSWPGERVDEEHEKQARIDSDVILELSGVSLPFSALQSGFQRLRCGGEIQLKKGDFVKLTLPTVPMALTYVQLLARRSLSQYCFYNGE